jgi:hypothetical protein
MHPAAPPPPPPPPPIISTQDSDLDTAVSMLVPLRVDMFALAAGYLALLSPLGLVLVASSMPWPLRFAFGVPAAMALLLGTLALQHIRRTPGRRGAVRAWLGIILPAVIFTADLVYMLLRGPS